MCSITKSALPVQTGYISLLAFKGFGARLVSEHLLYGTSGTETLFFFFKMVPQVAELCCLSSSLVWQEAREIWLYKPKQK